MKTPDLRPTGSPRKRNGAVVPAELPRARESAGAHSLTVKHLQAAQVSGERRLRPGPRRPDDARNGRPILNGAARGDKWRALEKAFVGLLGTPTGPNITFVYQDEQTRTWARSAYDRLAALAGTNGGLRASWWKIQDMSVPGILAGAVSSAVHADLIVVASRAEGLPLPFYVWVNLWWPHRSDAPGLLVALLGAGLHRRAAIGSVAEYLPIVAQQARMNFLKIQQPLSAVGKLERPSWCRVAPNGHELGSFNSYPAR